VDVVLTVGLVVGVVGVSLCEIHLGRRYDHGSICGFSDGVGDVLVASGMRTELPVLCNWVNVGSNATRNAEVAIT
jgi:hypothetical protein